MSEYIAQQKHWKNWLPADLSSPFIDKSNTSIIPVDCCNEKKWQEELVFLRNQAEEQGFKQGQKEGSLHGYQEGFDQGYKEGFQKGLKNAQKEQEVITTQIANFLLELKNSITELDSTIPEQLMQIAIEAAGRIIGQSPICDSSFILKTIQQLLHKNFSDDSLKLYIHPDDLSSLHHCLGTSLEEQGWKLISDNQLLRGGCRIITKSGEIDATRETRWQKLCHMLKEDWLYDHTTRTLD